MDLMQLLMIIAAAVSSASAFVTPPSFGTAAAGSRSSSSHGALSMSLADRAVTVTDLTAAPVNQVLTIQEYEDLLAENPDKLVVVKWFAPWCRSCKSLDVSYRKLATGRRDVVFADVNVHASADLRKAHKVNAIPAVHMYSGGAQIENFKCGPDNLPQLKYKLDLHAGAASTPRVTSSRSRFTAGGLMEKFDAVAMSV